MSNLFELTRDDLITLSCSDTRLTSSLPQDDAQVRLLTVDAATGRLRWRDASTVGGVVDEDEYRTRFVLWLDTFTNSGATFPDGFLSSNSGSGSVAVLAGSYSTNGFTDTGVQFTTSTSASDAAGMTTVGTLWPGTAVGGYDNVEWHARVRTGSANWGSGLAHLVVGLVAGTSTPVYPTHSGVYFFIEAGDTFWSTRHNSSDAVSSVAYANGTWYRLSVVWNVSGSDLKFYINDTLVRTVSSSIIASEMRWALRISNDDTLARNVGLDYLYYSMTVPQR